MKSRQKKNPVEDEIQCKIYTTWDRAVIHVVPVFKDVKKRHYRRDRTYYYKTVSVPSGQVSTILDIWLKIKEGTAHPKVLLGVGVLDKKGRMWIITEVAHYDIKRIRLTSFTSNFISDSFQMTTDQEFDTLIFFDKMVRSSNPKNN